MVPAIKFPEKRELISDSFKKTLFKFMKLQTWPGVCDVKVAGMGRGIISTEKIEKDTIVMDYCAKIITGMTAEEYLENNPDSSEYLFEIQKHNPKLLFDASNEPCPNHPNSRCYGRLINHEGTSAANISPRLLTLGPNTRVLCFVAKYDIPAFQQLLFDYGDVEARRQFRQNKK